MYFAVLLPRLGAIHLTVRLALRVKRSSAIQSPALPAVAIERDSANPASTTAAAANHDSSDGLLRLRIRLVGADHGQSDDSNEAIVALPRVEIKDAALDQAAASATCTLLQLLPDNPSRTRTDASADGAESDVVSLVLVGLRIQCNPADLALATGSAKPGAEQASLVTSNSWQWLGLHDSTLLSAETDAQAALKPPLNSQQPPDQAQLERGLQCRSCQHPISVPLRPDNQRKTADAASVSPSSSTTRRTITAVHPLPSENWMELIDCWVCHKEEYKQFQRGEIQATERMCLVGETYLLLHPEDIVAYALEYEGVSSTMHHQHRHAGATKHDSTHHDHHHSEQSKSTTSTETPSPSVPAVAHQIARCPKCRAMLGRGVFHQKYDPATSTTTAVLRGVRLFKYQLLLADAADQAARRAASNAFAHHTLETFLAQELLIRLLTSQTSKFVVNGLVSSDSGSSPTQTFGLLWLFNWELSVLTDLAIPSADTPTETRESDDPWIEANKKPDSLNQKPGVQHIIRVMYKDASPAALASLPDDASRKALLEEARMWRQDANVDEMQLASETCLELMSMLRRSTLLFPESLRPGMGGMKCGFLQRIVPGHV
ncbi:hypothetical protein CAOG_05844 [Capsaspora owczarzaki ATCC 30864]|uniref:Uncharacterized protein n=1 Tax=Capsaspora owczarzaki (strain ATCC 30864) TaxID=595528 RepID=A0A0D2WSU7_CAPO3|nr:hypothetical protein CAOG_05844 [Capsaspora owczarzaki ATCC 30864]KJE95390.1 hypothetical protein CAOG_005844 [Capsaspora owczarzaki ATCC 30864]|eukprot:XP_004345434.1 hypothetical protein CAOG_05844 [Capsaspora owczarzaki ATCC 30864]